MTVTDDRRRAEPSAGLRQAGLRSANLGLVLRTALAAQPPLSRAGVAAATGVTRSTVSRLADELVAAGLLAEADTGPTTGPGRPGTPLVAGRAVAALGLQVDVGQLAVRVVDLRGAVLAEVVEPGRFLGSEPAPVLGRLGRLAAELLAERPLPPLAGVGLALPGLVDDGAALRYAPNLGWSDVVPGPLLRRGGLAVADADLRLGNEADLAALAWAYPAPGRAARLADFCYLSGAVGIGGAVVRDGALVRGRRGWAGELGHVCVDPHGPPCRCGSTGCLEQYAGRAALLAAAGLPPDAEPATLLAAGTARAEQALDRAAWALGVALASTLNVVDVPAVVLGGHLGPLGERLRAPLEAALATRVLGSRWAPVALFHTGPDRDDVGLSDTDRTGDDDTAGATGAALLALRALIDDPSPWLAEAG